MTNAFFDASPVTTTLLPVQNPAAESPLFYAAYGLAIRSQIPLPEFLPLDGSDARFDATVVYGNGEDWINPVRQERSFWSIRTHEARFWFQGVAGFLVRAGREIIISPEPKVEQSLLRVYEEGVMT